PAERLPEVRVDGYRVGTGDGVHGLAGSPDVVDRQAHELEALCEDFLEAPNRLEPRLWVLGRGPRLTELFDLRVERGLRLVGIDGKVEVVHPLCLGGLGGGRVDSEPEGERAFRAEDVAEGPRAVVNPPAEGRDLRLRDVDL